MIFLRVLREKKKYVKDLELCDLYFKGIEYER